MESSKPEWPVHVGESVELKDGEPRMVVSITDDHLVLDDGTVLDYGYWDSLDVIQAYR